MKTKMSLLIEIAGIATTVSGILIEYFKKLDLGYQIISIGGILIAGGSLLWVYVIRKK